MRIEKLRRSGDSTRARVSATVIWEESSREPQEYYFETLNEFADGMAANPHAFLVPCTIAALRHGEKRVAIDATICPELKAGLTDAIRLLQFWWTGKPRPAVTIEARGTGTSKPQTIPGAAFCFTGGIDSLTVLRRNRMDFLPHHAGYLRDGVLVFGLEVQRLDAFEHVADVLRRCATAAGISMVPVYTNIQDLDKDWTFWQNEFEAAGTRVGGTRAAHPHCIALDRSLFRLHDPSPARVSPAPRSELRRQRSSDPPRGYLADAAAEDGAAREMAVGVEGVARLQPLRDLPARPHQLRHMRKVPQNAHGIARRRRP